MGSDPLKSAWGQATGQHRDIQEIQAMARKKSPPVLKDIRRQLTIESLAYAAFLLVYYDFFDGHQKPFYLNLLLVLSVLLMLLHNIAGYWIIKDPVKAGNLKQSLEKYLSGIKQYSVVSITSRVLGITGFLLFFMMNIRWTSGKYWICGVMVLIICVQLFSLYKIWSGRIKKISRIVEELRTP